MHLRKLSLHGFKAFAGVQEFDFSSGMTAIIGPNGSGKSNVADAIRWVFGEQSNKNIRAKKTEDVIFFGSDTKRSMGIAEVTVVLDNEDKWLPLDFAEVSITRKAHRSGDNEYFINANKVRYSDVMSLMHKANMHQNSYAFVSQGLADKIIELKPFERRVLIEEAANIGQFRSDLVLTKRRIVETKDNILKVDFILKELKPRVNFYEKFQKKIILHKEISIELDLFLDFYYQNKLIFLLNSGNNFHKERNSIDQSILENKKSLGNISTDINKADMLLVNHESSIQKNRNSQMSIVEEIGQIDKALALVNQKIAELNIRKNSIIEDLSNLKNMNNNLVMPPVESNLLEDKINLEKKKERILGNISKINGDLEKNILLRNTTQINLDVKYSDLSQAKESLFLIEKLIREIEVEMNLLEQFYKEAPVDNDNINSLLNDFVNNDSSLPKPNILGSLSRLIDVPMDFEKAIEASLSGYLNAIIVKNIKDAKICFDFLNDNDLGTAKILILDTVPMSPPLTLMKENGIINIASKVVKADKIYQNLINALLGNIIIVSNLEKAHDVLSRGIGQVVTKDGTLLVNNFTFYGGSKKSNGNHFSIQSRIDILNDNLEENNNKIPKLKINLENIEKIIIEQRKLISESEKLIQLLETEKSSFVDTLNLVTNNLSSITGKLNFDEINDNSKNIDLDGSQLSTIEIIKNKESELKEINIELSNNEKHILSLSKELTILSDKKNDIHSNYLIIEKSIKSMKNANSDLFAKRNNFQKNLQNLENKQFLLNTKIDQNNIIYNELLENIQQDGYSIDSTGNLILKLNHEDDEYLSLINKLRTLLTVDDLSMLNADQIKRCLIIINELKIKLLKLGTIDKDIESDLISDKQRYDELIVQIEDLTNSEDELSEVIKKLELSISEKFDKAFESVSFKFNEFFAKVFDGGTAELKLISAENKSDSGIDIIVKPPGKRLSSLSSLSGGERAMTSVALMFALMSVNPSPICVLDEIDAALDDANIKRFLSILKELSSKSQFIVITHNRLTVQEAETVYGVSMEQDATSTVLSLKIKDLV